MVSLSNTSLSIFISELRTLDINLVEKRILQEQKKLLAEKTMTYSKILTLVYFVVNKYNIDPMMFVNASAQDDYNIKKAGYLGLTLIKNNNLLILTVNTVMKDLQSFEYRELALNFLCNINIKDKIYDDLSDFICIQGNNEKNIEKGIIAKSRISNIKKFTLVGNNDQLLFIKIQIIYDKMCAGEDIDLSDNDIFFLIAVYSTVKCPFLKLKLIQLYKLLYMKHNLLLSDSFILEIENDIISPTETIKTTVFIGLSIEICEFLIVAKKISQKVENFICRLLDSKNSNSRYFGFKIASTNNILTTKLLDRSIKVGINFQYAFDTLKKLISKKNYKEIFRRKEEMRFVMDRNLVEYCKSQEILTDIFIEILKFADEDFIVKMFAVHPEIAFKTDVKNILSDKYRRFLFDKIINNPSLESIYLFYSLITKNFTDRKFLEELFSSHLDVLLVKKYDKKFLTLEKMIFNICKLQNLDFFKNVLILKFQELFSIEQSNDVLDILLNGVCLFNPNSEEKSFLIFDSVFLSYKLIDTEYLYLKIENDIQFIKIYNKKGEKLESSIDESKQWIKCFVKNIQEISLNIITHSKDVKRTLRLK